MYNKDCIVHTQCMMFGYNTLYILNMAVFICLVGQPTDNTRLQVDYIVAKRYYPYCNGLVSQDHHNSIVILTCHYA